MQTERKSRSVNLSLRLSLGSAFVLAIVTTAFVLGAVTFLSVRNQLRQNLAQRIMNLASVAVLGLDAREHSTLKASSAMEGEAYKRLRALLQRVQAIDSDIKYVYTLRRVDEATLMFVLDTGATEKDFSPLGQLYTDMSPELSASFVAPYRPRVEDRKSVV